MVQTRGVWPEDRLQDVGRATHSHSYGYPDSAPTVPLKDLPASGLIHIRTVQGLCESDVAVLRSPYLIVLMLSGRKATLNSYPRRAQDLCESRGGRPGLPVPNSLSDP